MSLIRKQIRKNILSILNGRTGAGPNVFFNRTKLNWAENLPAINCYFRGEPEITELAQAPREMKRMLQLEVEIICRGNTDSEAADQIDDLCEQVESLLSLDETIGNCADDIVLTSMSDIEGVSEAEKPTMATSLTYMIKYYTYAPRQGAINLQDFKTYSGEWNLEPGQNSLDRANDLVNI